MSKISTIHSVVQAKLAGGTLSLSKSDFSIEEVVYFFDSALKVDQLSFQQEAEATFITHKDTSVTINGNISILGFQGLDATLKFEELNGVVSIYFDGRLPSGQTYSPPVVDWIAFHTPSITVNMTGKYNRITHSISGDLKLGTLDLPLIISKLYQGQWKIEVRGRSDQLFQLPDLSHISGLMNGEALDAFLPSALQQTIGGLAVTRLTTAIDTQKRWIPYFSAGFRYANQDDESGAWEIAPSLTVRNLNFTLTILNPIAPSGGNTSQELNFDGLDLPEDKTDYSRRLAGLVFGDIVINSVTIPIYLQVSTRRADLWKFGIQQGRPITLPRLSDVMSLAGGDDFLNTLPEGFKNIPTVIITRLEIDFRPSAKTLDLISFKAFTGSRWEIIADYFTVENLIIDLSISNANSAQTRAVSGLVRSTLLVGRTHVQFSLSKAADRDSWIIAGSLVPGETINLTGIAARLLEGFVTVPSTLPQITFDSINFTVDTQSKHLIFSAGSTDPWVVKENVFIQSFQLGFDYNPQSTPHRLTGSISGILEIAGTDLSLAVALESGTRSSWLFKGSTGAGQDIHISTLITDIGQKFGVDTQLPSAISDLTISNIYITYYTQTKDFTFSLETEFSIDQKKLDAVISIELTHNNEKYTRKFSGIVKIDDLEFDLIFNQEQDADTIFLAAYENKAGKDESIQPLVELITENKDILKAAKDISFNLKDALLVVDKGSETKILFGLDIGGGLDISKLPLVGEMFPASSTVRMTFQPLLTNKDFAAADLNKVRPLIPGSGYQLPQEAKERLGFNMQLLIGQEAINLSLPIGVDAVKDQPSTSNVPPASTTSTDIATAAPPATSANIKWFAIQKQLGPVNFGRVGVQFQNSQLYVLLDASLSLAELNISLDSLFASSTLNPIHPRFGLHGLGIDYKKGPLEIGGAFLRQTLTDPQGNTYDTYDGTAIIRTEKFELAALGSYAYYQGHPSLFIYAFVDVPLGGPAFFFVTGLAAGFGYNRRIVVPSIAGIKTFPLVAEAMSPVPGAATDLSTEINKLHEVIPPAVGEAFLAVGIRFSSFKIIDSFVLLTVSFGLEFDVDVLGLSTLVIPTPETGTAVEPLAEVQMALKAVFNPDKGYLKVRAGLTSASFILSRNCHLTGGFAFYTWFKDNPEENAVGGDFVLTLGGYHPRFKPPAYYPKVARLGFNWPVTREFVVKGDFYFALVSSAVMTGGHLSATWTSGNLKAWFQVGADFVISWKPYFYDASMYLDMGVSYAYHLFGTHHITVDVGADLRIWGPEFSGKAHVHLWIVTFDVAFGAYNRQDPAKLTWDEFRDGFLPANSNWANVSVTKGLVKQLGTDDDPLFVINPKDFMLETSSALPVTVSKHALGDSNTSIHIGSMKITDAVVSTHDITIKRGTTDVTADFEFAPVKKHVPGALWGSIFKHTEGETEDQRLVKNACMGFSITGKPVLPSAETHSVSSEKLLNEEEEFGNPIAYGAPATLGGQWLKSSGVRETVAREIEVKNAERNDLLKVLGFQDEYRPNKELADEFILSAA